MSALADAAVRLAAEGSCHVFPVIPDHKSPATKHGCLDATADPGEVRRMWQRYAGRCNIGIGWGPSRLVVVDLDGSTGIDTWGALLAEHPVPATLTASTPRPRGFHLYFRAPTGRTIRNDAKIKLGPGVDVRGDGGYVVAPPSHLEPDPEHDHPGGDYRWLPGPPAVAALPGWLVERLDPPKPPPPPRPLFAPPRSSSGAGAGYADAALHGEIARVVAAPIGTRNTTLRTAAYALGRLVGAGVLELPVASYTLTEAGHTIGLPTAEVCRTVTRGLADGALEPRDIRPRVSA